MNGFSLFKYSLFVCLYLFPISIFGASPKAAETKILICGVCKNIEPAIYNSIVQIEQLSTYFLDYQVIIYENNSNDRTPAILSDWSKGNNKITFITENLTDYELRALGRTEKIARARNQVLAEVRKIHYQDYDYLLMVDLDFLCLWPIDEIINTIESEREWDCVSANSLSHGMWWVPTKERWDLIYNDRYAFRDKHFPLGPELLGDSFWKELPCFIFEGLDWKPVYSAFGGLAIYKTASILSSSYSGTVNRDLQIYYGKIIDASSPNNVQIQKYLNVIGCFTESISSIPIYFQYNTLWEMPVNSKRISCCEHIPLHASMALKGYGKFYVNPKLILRY